MLTIFLIPHNLFLLFQSIIKGTSSTDDIFWFIIYDGGKIVADDYFDFTTLEIPNHLKIIIDIFEDPHSVAGNGQRNCAIMKITDGWVYFLDDDNLLHPEMFSDYQARPYHL